MRVEQSSMSTPLRTTQRTTLYHLRLVSAAAERIHSTRWLQLLRQSAMVVRRP